MKREARKSAIDRTKATQQQPQQQQQAKREHNIL
jgi:hypothetical protein